MENENLHIPIKQLEQRIRSIIVRLPAIVGNEAVNFVLDNFKNQGFMGDSFRPWLKRKNPNKWGMAPKRNGRAILVDTGRLRRSIRITRTTPEAVYIGTDVPYAKAHNEGSRIGLIQTVKAHQRKKMGMAKVSSLKTKKTKTVKTQTGTILVKEHTRKINQNIPKRQFMGPSQWLNRKIMRLIKAEIMKAYKQ